MSGREMVESLQQLGWSMRHFGDKVGYSDRQVRHWAAGTYQIPGEIAQWLRTIRTTMSAIPPPDVTDFRRRGGHRLHQTQNTTGRGMAG